MFRLISSLLVTFIFIMSIGVSASATDDSRTMIIGCPENHIDQRTNLGIGSQLTREDSLAIMSPRFEGDTFNLLVIPVEYTVYPSRYHTYSREVLDTLIFSEGVRPTGSLVEYYNEVSYGRFTISGDVVDWFDNGSYPYSCLLMHKEVIPKIDSLIDFTQYDGNHDGIVDGVIFLIAGNALQDTQDATDP